jgi:Arc/MetJ-type ribon-helix-helix transcriptional regulator
MTDKVTRNVSLDPYHDQIVDELRQERNYGERGYSQAIRDIIREWDEMKRTQASIDATYSRMHALLTQEGEENPQELPH